MIIIIINLLDAIHLGIMWLLRVVFLLPNHLQVKISCFLTLWVTIGRCLFGSFYFIIITNINVCYKRCLLHRFYDNLSVLSLGSLVVCGVGGAALWMGVAASGGLASLWSPESGGGGLSWVALTSGGTLVSLILLAWSCAGLQAHRHRAHHLTHQLGSLKWQCHEIFGIFYFMNPTHRGPWLTG